MAYQRLQHPNGLLLSKILSYDLFAGKLYVAAEFVDGSRYQYYDGVRVENYFDGRARAGLSRSTTAPHRPGSAGPRGSPGARPARASQTLIRVST